LKARVARALQVTKLAVQEAEVATTFQVERLPDGRLQYLPEILLGETVPVHLLPVQQRRLARHLGLVPLLPQGLPQQAQAEVLRPGPPLGAHPAALRLPLYPLPQGPPAPLQAVPPRFLRLLSAPERGHRRSRGLHRGARGVS